MSGYCLRARSAPLRLALPALNSASDATAALAAITATVAEGKIAPGGGESLTGIIAGYVRAAELSDIEARVAALEQKVSSNGK
jgi:hypothetical protein